MKAAGQAGFNQIKINCVIEESSSERNACYVAKFSEENGYEIRYIRLMDMQGGTFWSVEGGDGGNCEACNRMRLSSVGKIYPCLFNDISFSVREIGIENALKAAILHKPKSGEFAENITTLGIDLTKVNILDRFKIGDALLEVTQIGKKCHGEGYAIYREVVTCVMPKEGIFCRVLEPGTISSESEIEFIPKALDINIITLSDKASSGEYEDLSGPQIEKGLEA